MNTLFNKYQINKAICTIICSEKMTECRKEVNIVREAGYTVTRVSDALVVRNPKIAGRGICSWIVAWKGVRIVSLSGKSLEIPSMSIDRIHDIDYVGHLNKMPNKDYMIARDWQTRESKSHRQAERLTTLKQYVKDYDAYVEQTKEALKRSVDSYTRQIVDYMERKVERQHIVDEYKAKIGLTRK